MTIPSEHPEDLSKPRILMLHGGGSNSQVFHIQCRVFNSVLSPYFRLVFANAPYKCPAHFKVEPVYGEMGPFLRWLRWLPEHPEVDRTTACRDICDRLNADMAADAGTGPWVGVFGFSQGSKLAASILYTQQLLKETFGKSLADTWDFKFGVLMAGSPPPVILDERLVPPMGIDTAENIGFSFKNWPVVSSDDPATMAHRLRTPTLHILGTRDPGLAGHRKLYNLYSEPGTAELFEWDGEHRVPITKAQVEMMSAAIIDLARKSGVVVERKGQAIPL